MLIKQSLMKNKIISNFLVILFLTIPSFLLAHEIPKPSFKLGASIIIDKAFDTLSGDGVKIDDSDIVTSLLIDYYVSPGLAFEGGIISSSEVSASLPNGDSGILHGKSYSTNNNLTLSAKTNLSYLFGIKYIPSLNDSFNVYGKAGLLFWDIDFLTSGSGTLTYDGSTFNSSTFLKVDGSDPYIGIGLSYKLSHNNSLNFDYMSTLSTNAIQGAAIDLSKYTLSWSNNF
tara:strand:- start:380 stop:1066 length:687 start_codon:yes stop_codon:yes gene_type:complete